MKTESKHVTLVMWEVSPRLCNDLKFCVDAVTKAVLASNVTMLDIVKHKFNPQGLTVLALLSESHISIHTYPEHGYIAVDMFTCGDRADPLAGINKIRELFEPKTVIRNIKLRGRKD